MKTFITILSIVSTLSLASASLDLNLRYGQSGNQVFELQDFLSDKGFLQVSPTGFFGLLTLNAVKAYQVSQNLPNTGFVGQMTRKAINDELNVLVAPSVQAEANEPVVVIPPTVVATPAPQTPVYVPVPIIQPIIKVMPTCTLSVNPNSPDPIDNRAVKVDWTTTNATTGVIQQEIGGGWWKLMDITDHLESGTSPTFTVAGAPIRLRVTNKDGEAICELP